MIIFKLQKKFPKFQEAIFERCGLKKQKHGPPCEKESRANI